MTRPAAPLKALQQAILTLSVADYARMCAARIIGAGGPITQAGSGNNIYPSRTDLRIPHRQYDKALGRTVITTVRVRVTVEVTGWEPGAGDKSPGAW